MWNTKIGQFIASGTAAMLAYWIVWPFELMKNLAQAENNDFGKTTFDRAKYIYKNQGVLGFYRGILPGSQSIFFRNGASMLVMQYFNRVITERGWRE